MTVIFKEKSLYRKEISKFGQCKIYFKCNDETLERRVEEPMFAIGRADPLPIVIESWP